MQRPLATLGLVVVGGAFGAGLRAAVVVPLGTTSPALVVPAATLVVNVVGAFLLGVVVGRLADRRPLLRAFAGTGVLGGFTTYSAFAVQVVDVGGSAPVVGLALAAVSLIAGAAAAVAGLGAGRRGGPARENPEDAE